jgi:PKD repeat protein
MRLRLALVVALSVATLDGCSCEAPAPNLHVSPGSPVAVGQTVTFDSNSQPGDPPDHINTDAQLSWDLDGDGNFETSGGRVQQKRYDAPGTYLVTFDVKDLIFGGFIDGDVPADGFVTQKIVVVAPQGQPGNQAPTASFDYSPAPGYTENPITFDASGSSDVDGHIVKYDWDWTADGSVDDSSTSPTIKHAYPFAGTYTVRLAVTDDLGASSTTERTIQVQDGVPPGKAIARESAGVTTAAAGGPFTLTLGRVSLDNGTTTVAGVKLLTAGIRAHGRVRFKRAPAVFGRHRSARWAGAFALLQRGNGGKAKLTGQGYLLLSFTKRDSLCLAGSAAGGFKKSLSGRLAAVGGKGFGARLRGAGTFGRPTTTKRSATLKGRLKLRRVHKPRGLPKACRKLVRDLPR